ncbi:MAG: LuxR C-terminal-related transcriptional regulator [Panacagrimonas sp.]
MFTHALVVEDHADATVWLTGCLLRAFPGIAVSTAATCREGAAKLERQPQLALIDLNLPDGFGIDLIKKASHMKPPVCSIVTTVYDDEAHILPALRAGACGYLLKDEPQDDLVRQLLLVARDEHPLSPSVTRSVLKYLVGQNAAVAEPGEPLTPIEREILVSIANGYTLSEVAQSRTISRNTVATHVKRIYDKLGIKNRPEAVLAAQRIGLLARS